VLLIRRNLLWGPERSSSETNFLRRGVRGKESPYCKRGTKKAVMGSRGEREKWVGQLLANY